MTLLRGTSISLVLEILLSQGSLGRVQALELSHLNLIFVTLII